MPHIFITLKSTIRRRNECFMFPEIQNKTASCVDLYMEATGIVDENL
jgi:hypothetical protein